MAGGDGVEGETLSQVIGVIEPSVLDAGTGLQHPEVFLNRPSALVPGEDGFCGLRVRAAFGGQQQPVQGLLARGRIGFGCGHGEHIEWFPAPGAAGAAQRCCQLHPAGAQVELCLARGPRPLAAAGGDLHGMQRRRRTDIPCRFGAQHRTPVRRQRLHPNRARDRAAAATGRLSRQSQHPRGQTVNPHAGQEQKAMVVDDLREVRGPRVRRPADEAVARLLMPARGAKPDTAKAVGRCETPGGGGVHGTG